MDKFKKRKGYSFTIENSEAVITIIRPLSGELLTDGQYIVLYEDAHGFIEVHTLRIKEIASNYNLDEDELKETV